MIENLKAMIRIEYEDAGKRRDLYGEIDKNKFNEIKIEFKHYGIRRATHEEINENKLDGLHSEGEDFICLANDEKVA